MSTRNPVLALEQFTTFGDLLRYLRRRAGLTQIELSVAVGYSNSQISRLEQNLRLPDIPTLTARFVPALGISDEPDVVSRLLELAAGVRREDAPTAGLPPFKGLLHFEEADAELFFGREALTAKLKARVMAALAAPDGPRFLAIVGASGSGKSSVVRAGLIPALRWAPESAGWPMYLLTPTAHPLAALAESLLGDTKSSQAQAKLAGGLAADPGTLQRTLAQGNLTHTLLIVDQFEELFTLCWNEAERCAFVDNLLTAALHPEGRVLVVITLRADFYAYCARYATLRQTLAQCQEYMGAMSAAELCRAIEEPARRGHWELEPGLVDLLLRDVGANETLAPEPGALPLLSHALLETWQRRRGRTLTLGGYAASGGVRGAIAETAEAVFQDQLNAQQRAVARHVFLQLTELGEDDTVPDTRRRVALRDLAADPDSTAMVREVLTLLADARLIITEAETAEVAHEALIREWPTLREWLNADREGLRLHRHLSATAQEWARLGRDPGELYRGARLAQAAEWAAANAQKLSPVESEFIQVSASLAAREEAEREDQRQRELAAAQRLAATEKERAAEQARAADGLRVRSRLLMAASAAALLLAVLAAAFGLQASASASRAAQQQATAVAERERADLQAALALQAEDAAEADRDRADQQAQLARAAEATAQAHRQQAEQAAAEAFAHELAVQSNVNLAADPERSILLALAAVDTAPLPESFSALQAATLASRIVWRADPQAGWLLDVAFTPDGRQLVTSGQDGQVRLWAASTGKLLQVLPGHGASIGTLDLSRDGQRLATGGDDGTVGVWDLASGQMLWSTESGQTQTAEMSVEFSPNGQRLAVAGGPEPAVHVYDAASGVLLETWEHPDWPLAEPAALHPIGAVYSPDGTRLAIALDTPMFTAGQVEVWDAQSRERLLVLPERFSVYRNGLAFSPDGARLATGWSAAGPAAVWDVITGERLFSLRESANRIRFSADGQRLLTATAGAKVGVWDAATGGELLTLAGHASLVPAVAESPECAGPPAQPFEWCGRWLASVSLDGSLRLWDISPLGGGAALAVPGGGPKGNHSFTHGGQRLTTLLVTGPQGSEWKFQQWRLPPEPGRQPNGYLSHTVKLDPGVALVSGGRSGYPGSGYVHLYETGRVHALDAIGATVADFCCIDLPVSSIQLAGDLRVLIVVHPAGDLEVWDTASGQRVSRVQLAEMDPLAAEQMAIDYAGTRAAFVLAGKLRVVDTGTGKAVLDDVDVGSSFQGMLRFSPHEDTILVMDCTGSLTLHELPGGRVRWSLPHSGGCFHGADISPDGRLLAAVTTAGPLKVWDLTTGTVVFEIPRLNGMGGPRFSPDGRLIYVSGPDVLSSFTVRAYFTQLQDLVVFARSRLTRGLTQTECEQYLRQEACP